MRNFQSTTFEELETYLFETGKTEDPKWLNNYLIP